MNNPVPEKKPVILPRNIPQRPDRQVQKNIPPLKAERDRILKSVFDYVDKEKLVPPIPFDELKVHGEKIVARYEINPLYLDFTANLINNAAWHDQLAGIPFEKRLLLLPVCLRHEEKCTAPFDEFGLLCKKCGLCSIHDLTDEAERLGYAVLVAEGTPLVKQLIETGKIEAVVGVSCLNVLERVFPYMESAAVPGIAIPLLQDDCKDTNLDLSWLWDVIHLTADDKTWRLNLDELRDEVDSWFSEEKLSSVINPNNDPTAAIAVEWLAQEGKRWRPFLTACMFMASQENPRGKLPEDLVYAAMAVECFHKASLIHDDIEDGDRIRYGKETLHERYGIPVAINIGDFLQGEGYRLLAMCDLDDQRRRKMMAAAADGHRRLSEGQGAELLWDREPKRLEPKDVIAIFRQKTAPAFDVALRIGAIYAGIDERIWDLITEYSDALGIAYQIRDDRDDFFGDVDSHDLENLRPSVLLALAYERAGKEDRPLLKKLWEKKISFSDHEKEIGGILEKLDLDQRSRDLMDAYKEEAIRSLRELDNPSIKGLLRRIIGKIFDDGKVETYCHEFQPGNAAGSGTGTQNPG